jgi:hypothetical protein
MSSEKYLKLSGRCIGVYLPIVLSYTYYPKFLYY